MATEYSGAGGVRVFYGPRPSPNTLPDPAPSTCLTYGVTRELELRWDYTNPPAPTATSTNDACEQIIPANSLIIAARLYVEKAFAGGTSIAVDQRAVADGSVVTANGYITATQGAEANLTLGAWIIGTGALVGATSGTADTKLGVTNVGTHTAGRGRLILTFIPGDAH